MLLPLHLNLQVAAPIASLGGTAYPSLTEKQVRDGGKTILIELTNDTWVAAGATFDAIRQDIIDGLTADTAQLAGWNNVVRDSALQVTDVVRTSDTLVTITLPAAPTYSVNAHEEITVTIPASALDSGSPLSAGTISIIAEVFVPSGSSDPAKHKEHPAMARRDKLRMEDEELLQVIAATVERIYEFTE